jgi:hypothetical protein
MPFNFQVGQSIIFAATFFDATGVATTLPTSATLTVTYPLSSASLTTTSCSIAMTAVSSANWTATWPSSVAAAGISSYTATAPGQISNAPGLSGTLRLMS